MGDKEYPERYRLYRDGQFKLGADEVYQFGFKLAARSGNDTIYPIDTFGPTLIDDNTAKRKAHLRVSE